MTSWCIEPSLQCRLPITWLEFGKSPQAIGLHETRAFNVVTRQGRRDPFGGCILPSSDQWKQTLALSESFL